MLTDWILACLHHVAVFSLAATLAAELALISVDLSARSIRRLAAIDIWYGLIAGAVIAFGVMRVVWGAKGYEYYLANHVFWTKMALFVAVGLLSIGPTLRYGAWRRKLSTEAAFLPPQAEVARVRTFLWLEAALFLCTRSPPPRWREGTESEFRKPKRNRLARFAGRRDFPGASPHFFSKSGRRALVSCSARSRRHFAMRA